jgi:hypothetical protein
MFLPSAGGVMQLLADALYFVFAKSGYDGAQTSLHCALSPDARPGQYYSDAQEWRTSTAAKDDQAARRCWDIAETLTKQQ